jgi:hypothetical protein
MTEETKAIKCEPVRISRSAMAEQDRAMLTKSAAQRVLGLSRWKLDNAIARGQVPYVRISKRLMIPAERARRMLGLAA